MFFFYYLVANCHNIEKKKEKLFYNSKVAKYVESVNDTQFDIENFHFKQFLLFIVIKNSNF